MIYCQQATFMLPIGHTGVVTDIKFSPDGRKIITIARDKTIKLWDVASGTLLLDITFNYNASTASFSPDGTKILAAGDSIIEIRNVSDGKISTLLYDSTGLITDACFSPDGNRIVSSSRGRVVKIWRAPDTSPVVTIKNITHYVTTVLFSPDGKKIVTVDTNKIIQIRDASNLSLLYELNKQNGISKIDCFSADSKKIVTKAIGDSVIVWDVNTGERIANIGRFETLRDALFSPHATEILILAGNKALLASAGNGKLLKTFNSHTSPLISAQFSKNGEKIITTSYDATAKIWNVKDDRSCITLHLHTAAVTAACFSFDANKVATASMDHTARLWDAVTGDPIYELAEHNSLVKAHFSPEGNNITTISWGRNQVKVWDEVYGGLLYALNNESNFLNCISFSHNNTIAACGIKYVVELRTVKNNKLLKTLAAHSNFINSVCFSSDDNKLITAARDSTALIWDINTGKPTNAVCKHHGSVNSACFSPDGLKVLTASSDSTAAIWNVAGGKPVEIFKGHKNIVNTACFSPEGNKVVTASYDSTAIVWNVIDGNPLLILKGHAATVNSACFSPDGKRIVTASWDHTAIIWDATTGLPLLHLSADNFPVDYACFTPDGKRVVTACRDNTSKVWDAQQGRLLSVFFAVDSNDYFIQIPSGYYMCTPGAAKLLHYVTSDLHVIMFQQLDVKYNRPDKVLEVINPADTALIRSYKNAYFKRIKKLGIDTGSFENDYEVPESDFANADTILTDRTNALLTLSIHCRDSIHFLEKFNLWINDVPLYGVKGYNLETKKCKSFDTIITVELSKGQNNIECAVTNSNGIESYRKPINFRYNPLESLQQKIYFVGIGISHFQDSTRDLKWSVKDIRDLTAALQQKYAENFIADTLFDTAVNITNVLALQQRLRNTTVNDKVIIAYSGHGLLSKTYDYYLSTYNINFDDPAVKGLPYEVLENLLDSIPCREKLMLIDACHSGEVDKDEQSKFNNRMTEKSSFELMQQLFANVSSGTGATVIAAAAGTQFAIEKNTIRNGIFTYSILESIQEHAHCSVQQLTRYVGDRVSEITHGLQVPTTRTENLNTDWMIW